MNTQQKLSDATNRLTESERQEACRLLELIQRKREIRSNLSGPERGTSTKILTTAPFTTWTSTPSTVSLKSRANYGASRAPHKPLCPRTTKETAPMSGRKPPRIRCRS
jgi:hypothetical protein